MLHAESLEWMSDLAFWREEMSFFYRILRTKEIKRTLPAHELEAIDQEMIKLTSENLMEMKKKVIWHERDLKNAIHPVLTGEEQQYRDKHRSLLTQMHHVQDQVREFKKRVYAFIAKYEYLADRIKRKNKY